MRNTAEAAIYFVKRIGNGAAAVYVYGCFVAPGDFGEWYVFTEDFARGFVPLFPGEMRSVVRGVDVGQPAPRLAGGAHFTFMTTSVRSSESGALCENQSTSFSTRSAISAAVIS